MDQILLQLQWEKEANKGFQKITNFRLFLVFYKPEQAEFKEWKSTKVLGGE